MNAWKSKSVIGYASDKKLQAVRRKKSIDLFVSRFEKNTTHEKVKESIADALKDDDAFTHAEWCTIQCVQLETKYDTYTSFRLTVTVDASIWQYTNDILTSPGI